YDSCLLSLHDALPIWPEVGRDWYRFAVCSLERKPVRATAGVSVKAGYGLSRLSRAGTIIIPGWTGYDAPVPPRLISTLRNAHARSEEHTSELQSPYDL